MFRVLLTIVYMKNVSSVMPTYFNCLLSEIVFIMQQNLLVLQYNKSLSRVPVDIRRCMKKAGGKYPDRLADSCKRSSVNWMVAGS